MSVTIKVSEETAAAFQGKVDRGLYPDLETAFAEAARLLDEVEYNRSLQAKIQVGLDQAERGEVVPWTRELSRQLFEEAMELHRLGIRPESDEWP
jgi:predicted transcriptional regulator